VLRIAIGIQLVQRGKGIYRGQLAGRSFPRREVQKDPENVLRCQPQIGQRGLGEIAQVENHPAARSAGDRGEQHDPRGLRHEVQAGGLAG